MDKPKKIYYTMGEVAEIFDVNCSLIRFWEKKFDILKPHKNNKGNRLFTPEDLENLKLIYHLVKENGMTLAGAEKRLKENRDGVERNVEIVEKLQRMRALLMEVKQELKIEDGATQYISSGLLEASDSLEMSMNGANGMDIEAFVSRKDLEVTEASEVSESTEAAKGSKTSGISEAIGACEIPTTTETPTTSAPQLVVIEQTLF